MANKDVQVREKLIALLKTAIEKDNEEREKNGIGEKFKFVRDKLSAQLQSADQSVSAMQQGDIEGLSEAVAEDETVVYVHLFNSQGIQLDAWKHMVKPDVMYEYTVNRPIYGEQMHIESFISGRPNREQHAYLAVAVKKDAVIKGGEEKMDPVGKPLVRLKEGALKHNRIQAFVHQEKQYNVTDQSKIILKDA